MGERGHDLQQRATDRNKTLGRCGKDPAFVHGAHAQSLYSVLLCRHTGDSKLHKLT